MPPAKPHRVWCPREAVDRREDHLVKDREEDVSHFDDWLVAQTTEDEGAQVLAGQHVPQSGTKSPCTGRIVRYVEDELRGFVIMSILDLDALEASWPAGVMDTVGDGLGGDGESVADGEFDGGRNSKGDVAVLVRSAQR